MAWPQPHCTSSQAEAWGILKLLEPCLKFRSKWLKEEGSTDSISTLLSHFPREHWTPIMVWTHSPLLLGSLGILKLFWANKRKENALWSWGLGEIEDPAHVSEGDKGDPVESCSMTLEGHSVLCCRNREEMSLGQPSSHAILLLWRPAG